MAQKMAVYKCEICGNIAEVLTAGGAEMMCCNQQMTMQKENTTDAAVEKHIPVLAKKDGGWQVTVGSVEHPMTAAHRHHPRGRRRADQLVDDRPRNHRRDCMDRRCRRQGGQGPRPARL